VGVAWGKLTSGECYPEQWAKTVLSLVNDGGRGGKGDSGMGLTWREEKRAAGKKAGVFFDRERKDFNRNPGDFGPF